MDDLFGFPALRIQQPGKLLPSRASYEIFNGDRQLLATAIEAESHTRVKLIPKGVPAARVLVVTTAGGEPALTLVTHTREHITELHDPSGEPVGQIRGKYTKRHYTLVDDQRQTVGRVVGDLGLKNFSVTGTEGAEFARIRKTWVHRPCHASSPHPDRHDRHRAGPDPVRARLTQRPATGPPGQSGVQ
jgi:hypothetical protein